MSGRLIINRYEEGKETQFMEITLHEEIADGQSKVKTICGPWMDGEILFKVKQPKLHVNILQVNENGDLDGDLNSIQKHTLFNSPWNSGNNHNNAHFSTEGKANNTLIWGSSERKSKMKIDEITEFLSKKAEISKGKSSVQESDNDPLDQKLEKIRKDNEKIMENILFLNKKLDYTRKKEIEESMSARLALVTFVCDKCGKSFFKNSSFQYHMRQHKLKMECETGNPFQVMTSKQNASKAGKPWVCPNCHQVWPDESLIREHLIHSNCRNSHSTVDVKDILQHAQKPHIAFLTQCEFCEKLFSSVPKALKHQKIHGTEKNYECTECTLTFSSYAAAARHWRQDCDWLTNHYCFTLYKCYACNVCYEKFDNLNNLYTHRYEYEHFFLKCSSTKGNDNTDKQERIQVENCEDSWLAANQEVGAEYSVRTDNSVRVDNSVRTDNPEKLEGPQQGQQVIRYMVHQCELCGFICQKQKSIQQHKEEGHSTLLCQKCGEISENRISFIHHMDQHTDAEQMGWY